MAASLPRLNVGTSATLLVAVGSAAYLAFSGDTHAAATLPRPMSNDFSRALETTMPTIRTLGDLLADMLQRFGERRPEQLCDLDIRTLADIGIHPSEIGSVEAESCGRIAVTRRRIVEAACHG